MADRFYRGITTCFVAIMASTLFMSVATALPTGA